MMLSILGLLGLSLTGLSFIFSGAADDFSSPGDDSEDGGAEPLPDDGFNTDLGADIMLPEHKVEQFQDINLTDEADISFGGDAAQWIKGFDGNDYIDGERGDDVVEAGAGNDEVRGGRGDDYLDGGEGDDLVYGGPGDDVLIGAAGNDVLDGGVGNDTVSGGTGDDRIMGFWGDDTLIGGAGSDQIYGENGDDILYGVEDGVAEADFLSGNNGNDVLIGGDGDRLEGGDGEDTFVVYSELGAVQIEDYQAGTDTVKLVYSGDEPPVLTKLMDENQTTVLSDGRPVAVVQGSDIDLGAIKLSPISEQ